jgi:hypothetical protein
MIFPVPFRSGGVAHRRTPVFIAGLMAIFGSTERAERARKVLEILTARDGPEPPNGHHRAKV